MDDLNIIEAIKALAAAIDNVSKRVDMLNESTNEMRNTLIEGIINPAIDAYRVDDFNRFNEKYGERLNAHDDVWKRTNGFDDSYTTSKAVYDELNNAIDAGKIAPEPSGNYDKYVDAVVAELENNFNAIRESLGLPKDAPIAVESDGAGEVSVEVDTDGDGKTDTEISAESNDVDFSGVEDVLTPEMEAELTAMLNENAE